MVKENIHLKIRSPRGCAKFRIEDPGRKGHTKLTLCLRKPKKGERPTKGRKYASEIQNILVEKGTSTFRSDLKRAVKKAKKACRKRGRVLRRKGKEDYACKAR